MNTPLRVSVVLTAVGLVGLVTAPQAAAYTDADEGSRRTGGKKGKGGLSIVR